MRAPCVQSLVSRFGWTPMEEEGRIIGVTLDGQSVTLEPGGQFELSGAPVDTIQKTCAEVNNHLYQVSVRKEEWGRAHPCGAGSVLGVPGWPSSSGCVPLCV